MVELQKFTGRGLFQKVHGQNENGRVSEAYRKRGSSKGGQLGNSRVAEAYRKRTFPKRLGKKGMVELQKFIGRGLSKKV